MNGNSQRAEKDRNTDSSRYRGAPSDPRVDPAYSCNQVARGNCSEPGAKIDVLVQRGRRMNSCLIYGRQQNGHHRRTAQDPDTIIGSQACQQPKQGQDENRSDVVEGLVKHGGRRRIGTGPRQGRLHDAVPVGMAAKSEKSYYRERPRPERSGNRIEPSSYTPKLPSS